MCGFYAMHETEWIAVPAGFADLSKQQKEKQKEMSSGRVKGVAKTKTILLLIMSID